MRNRMQDPDVVDQSRVKGYQLPMQPTPENFYVPTDVLAGTAGVFWPAYMTFSTPVASDFLQPEFAAFLTRIEHPLWFHRKLWEYAFIEHRLGAAGMLQPGKRGIGFGVGQEKLPELFSKAGCEILATDTPPVLAEARSMTAIVFRDGGNTDFVKRITYQTCDVTNIPETMSGYDFCWSSSCAEHLGNDMLGDRFIRDSLRVLKIGGIAVHTTQINLSSNGQTIQQGVPCIFRLIDFKGLVHRVRALGHEMDDIVMGPLITPVDHHIDVPPYTNNPHLKVHVGPYVTTSVGLVLKRLT